MTPRVIEKAVISVKDLSVVYGTRKVLDISSIDVFRNEVLAIIGPNGSGKSTLLLILALLKKPTTGVISYFGQQAIPRDILKLRREIAVVFQEPLLLDTSVFENVMIGLKLRGVNREKAQERVNKWLDRFGVKALAKRSAHTLSGGEAKRVSLARAFALEPEILLLDEPFTSLDSPTRQALLADFEGVLRETKVSTVMVTHDRNEALAVAHRLVVLMDGKIQQMGSPQEIFNCPADERVAGFVETGNILQGRVTAQNGGLAELESHGKKISAVSDLQIGTQVTICLRYEDVTISVPAGAYPATSARNAFSGKVTRIIQLGAQLRLIVDCGFPITALITKRSWEELGLKEGSEVIASFKATAIHLIPHR